MSEQDPIERVARAIWLSGNDDGKPFGSWDQVPEDPPDKPNTKTLFRDFARMAIYAHTAWLTEQGIPIKRLLSGEMVAVEVAAASDLMRAIDSKTDEIDRQLAQLDNALESP